MSRTSMKSIREMSEKDLLARIQESRGELAKMHADTSKGTMRKDVGKIKPMRRDIARMMTRLTELRRR
ncbi:MAG: 50S ribosomal protein L29 [Nitrosopumilaceae archaeon]|nr:50S ribosomal protein L29 [Nitrosopumilaceae archaeon]